MSEKRGTKIHLLPNFSLQKTGPSDRGKYEARQSISGSASTAGIESVGWRALTRQMQHAGYIPITGAEWHAGGYRRTYIPAKSGVRQLQLLTREAIEPLRRKAERLAHIRPGSPRSAAPRFDEDSFSKVMTKLTALGFWAVLLILLIRTEVNIVGLPEADAQVPIIDLLLNVAIGAKPVLTLILMAMALDPALYIGNRLWGQFGWSWFPTVATLWAVFFLAGTSLFGFGEIMRQLNTVIERSDSAAS